MANYGDCALQLPADWSRSKYENQEQVLMTVGHEGGEADLYLTEEPDAEHQFYWVDPQNKTKVTSLRMRGFDFVKKSTWTKRLDYLWEWNAEDLVYFAGQVAMARPKAKWLEDQAKRETINKRVRADSDKEIDRLPQGLVAADQPAPARRRRAGA